MQDISIDITIKTNIMVDDIEYCSPLCQFFIVERGKSLSVWEEHERCIFQFNNDNNVDIKSNYIHNRKRTEQCMNRTKARNFYLKKKIKSRENDITFVKNSAMTEEQMQTLIDDISEWFGITTEQMLSKIRTGKFVVARKIAIYILHEEGVPLLQSAHAVNLSDHSTAQAHHKEIKEYISFPKIYHYVLTDNIKAGLQFINKYKKEKVK